LADSKSVAPAPPDPSDVDPIQRAWEQGWKYVLTRLSPDEKSLLFEVLYLSAVGVPIPAESTHAAPEMLRNVQRLWDDYQSAAFQSVADLKTDDQSRWVDCLRQVNDRFTRKVMPSLKANSGHPEPDAAETTSLPDVLETLAAIDRAAIQDDTPAFRLAERDIWFHEMARAIHAEQLQPPSAARVAYLQLHKQPADYRGKLVTVKGTVRLAYRIPAPKNYLNAKEFCVYVLQPPGGPDAPIFVYALDAPDGFPRLGASSGDSTGKMREDVEVTGIFFKRCAYAGQGGTYTAPLVITKSPSWHPSTAANASANPSISPLELTGIAVAALLLAICITAVLWKRTSLSNGAIARQKSATVVDLGPLALGPSTQDNLRNLEQQLRGGDDA
jgi:hypothetical protein